MSLLSVRNLSFAYARDADALQDVSFEVGGGEFAALIGPNGAGKSTLLKALAGLLPIPPGAVRLEGRDLRWLPAKERGRTLAFVPQLADEAAPDLPVGELVSLGRLSHRAFSDEVMMRPLSGEDAASVRRAMQEADVEGLRLRSFRSLSGGERGRVRLAAAFAQESRLLLLDEPGAHLDLAHAVDMMERLLERRRRGQSVLMAIHDLTLASLFAERLLLLKDGRLVADGDAAEVLTADRLRHVFGEGLMITPHPRTGRPIVLPEGGAP